MYIRKTTSKYKGKPYTNYLLKEKAAAYAGEAVAVLADEVTVECAREAGTVHVANQMWRRLGMDGVLGSVGFSEKERLLTKIMVTPTYFEGNCPKNPQAQRVLPGRTGRLQAGGRGPGGGQRRVSQGARGLRRQ